MSDWQFGDAEITSSVGAVEAPPPSKDEIAAMIKALPQRIVELVQERQPIFGLAAHHEGPAREGETRLVLAIPKKKGWWWTVRYVQDRSVASGVSFVEQLVAQMLREYRDGDRIVRIGQIPRMSAMQFYQYGAAVPTLAVEV